jgi:magnesium-protoporphyrin IX monomethyl ester (oxidative) cyclase
MIQKRKIERVFLLFPPVRLYRETMKLVFSPLGIGYIASMIRNDVEVEIMDAAVEGFNRHKILDSDFILYGSSMTEIAKRIEAFNPDIVGMSCLFSSIFPVIRRLCTAIKKIDPDIQTIVGGNYPTFRPEYCMGEPFLDMISLGESENTMLEVIRHFSDGRSFRDIDGLVFRDCDKVVVNPKTIWIKDLDSIPFPSRDLLPLELYKKVGVPHSFSAASRHNAPMISSRGCMAHCIYCSSTNFWGNHYRFRSPENVIAEIDDLVKNWGTKEIQFEDDNFTANRARAKKIFEGIIGLDYKIKFNFPNGVALWTLDEELVDLMVEAGCYEMTLAFESGCQDVLRDIVKKPLNLEKAKRIAEYIKSKAIRTNAFYIFGFPGETKAQMRETFNFANKMKTDTAYFFVANPLPGTQMYELAKSRGMLRDDFNFENLTFTRSAYHEGVFPQGELEKMAGREFLKYNVRSFFRHPLVFFEKVVIDLLLKRPRYTIGMLFRIWRRNIR